MSLKSSYNAALAKQKTSIQTINKLKKELQSCKRRLAGRGSRPKSAGGANAVTDGNHSNDVQINLLERLASAENQLKSLSDVSRRSIDPDKENQRSNAQETRNQVQELTTKLNLLEMQHQHDEDKINAQCERLEQILTLHGQYKSKYTSIRRNLAFYKDENQELKTLLNESVQQNTFLEDQVTKLCEAPAESVQEKHLLLETIQQKQTSYDSLISEHHELRQEHEKLLSETNQLRRTSQEAASRDILAMKQKMTSIEDELDRTKQLLALQLSINDTIKKDHSGEIKEYQKNYDELTMKSAQRLQRIRLLEGLLEANQSSSFDQNGHCVASSCQLQPLGRDENILQILISNGLLHCTSLSDETRSFVLVDFHTYGSMMSPIVKGLSPAYDFNALYKLNMDRHQGSVKIGVYTVHHDKANLFAWAVTSADWFMPGVIGTRQLDLTHEATDSAPVGKLSVTLKLAQPIGLPKLLNDMESFQSHTAFYERQFSVTITVDRLIMTRKSETDMPMSYFVHYDFFLGDIVTAVQTPDANGEVAFVHNSTFPLLSSAEHIHEAVAKISKRHVRFVVFSGNKLTFNILGESHVELSELFDKVEMSAKLISLSSATVIGTLHIIGKVGRDGIST